jgi:hypothetical protein
LVGMWNLTDTFALVSGSSTVSAFSSAMFSILQPVFLWPSLR